MKVLFLIISFFSFILPGAAKRPFTQYTCQVSHKHSEVAFYMSVPETKEIEVGGWKVHAGLKRLNGEIEISLRRVVSILDATYQKTAKRTYAAKARTLPLELRHSFGGREDMFQMICYPKDP